MDYLDVLQIDGTSYELHDSGVRGDLAGYVNNGSYNSTSHEIELKHGNTVIATIDATAFIKDGMVESVAIVNGNLVITFNTDAGKQPISIPLTDIFNPANYYTKTEVDFKLTLKQDVINDLGDIRSGASAGATAYQKPSTGIPKTDLASGVQTSLDKADGSVQQEDFNAYKQEANTGIAYDVSVLHPTSGVNGGSTYVSISAALAVIPQDKRKGGMTVKFVHSSDNKYVQYFLTKDEWSASEADWEKLNLEDEVSQLGQEVDDLEMEEVGYKRILNGEDIPFKSGFYYRVDRNQEVQGGNNDSYCRIRVNVGDKFLVTGTSTSALAPFITVQEDNGTNHTASETVGTNLLYTVGFDGWLIVNNISSTVVPALKQTTDRFESIEGQVSTLNGQVSELNSQVPTKIDLSQVDFARRTIFNGGDVPFIEGKCWITTNNEEATDPSRKYSRIFLFAGTKIIITARSFSDSAKMLTEYPVDGSSPIISAETNVEDYEYTMQKDGYLVVNSEMVLTTSYIKVESNIPDYNVEADVQNVKQKIGVLEEIIYLTSSDYANLWSNGNKVFSSQLSTYNGFVISVHTGTKYLWTASLYNASVLSAYPVSGATESIIGSVTSGFTATPEMKYLLISLELATTTSMTVVTSGHGLERDSVTLKDTAWKNQIVPLDFVSGKLNGSGVIIQDNNYVVTRNFIDVSNGVLLTDGLLPYTYVFYDKNQGFLYFDQSFNGEHLAEASYCRLVFKAESISKLKGVYNANFENKKFPHFINITQEGVQISNGLKTTSASGVSMSYDKSSGIVAAVYAGGWLKYGEDGSKILLSLFPLMQPTNIKFVEVAAEGESMGNGHIYHNGIDSNIISLGSRVWRIMLLSYRGTPSEAFWVYRDYHYDTDTLDDAVEIKMSYGGELLSLNNTNRKSVINSISGLTDTGSDKFVSISSSLDYHEDTDTYYGCITGYGTGSENVYVLLFSSTDNLATLVPFAVFPYSTKFEASCIKINNRFYCISRENETIYHTGYSDDNGITWVYNSIPGTNNRPRLYRVNDIPMWCYGIKSVVSDIRNRSKIAIAHSTNPADIDRVLEDDFGLVYFDIMLKNDKMFIAYSSSPLTLDIDNGENSFDGKDTVKLVTL